MAENKKWILPPPSQIGVVVRDVEQVAAYYSGTFGLGPFQMIDFAPAKHRINGVPSPIRLKIGMAQWGNMGLELIQVLEGETAHKKFLQEHGEGLQHLGFTVDDFDGWLNYLESQGIGVLMNADIDMEDGRVMRAAYMASDKVGGILFELFDNIIDY